jgi:predicted KAP-like P-loop ATPase
MDRMIALLRDKNHNLEKFYWINEQEMLNFGVGNFDAVEDFYGARERILSQINDLDTLIDEECSLVRTENIPSAFREEVETLLRAKDELVKAILAQDLQILDYIEREKSNIIRELRASATAKRAVGAYANAERIKHLDQE